MRTSWFSELLTERRNGKFTFSIKHATNQKGWLAIAKLIPLSLFISLLSMIKKAFYNVEIAK